MTGTTFSDVSRDVETCALLIRESICDDDIRLFTADRNKHGHVEIRRVQVSEKLLKMDQSLSRLWINGVLGGVPELL